MDGRHDTQELARGYTVANDTQSNAALFLLNRLQVRPGAKVLDVGCGPGNLTLHLKDIVGDDGSVVGIDPSEERIGIARQTATPGVSYFVGIAEDLSRFAPDTFDIVFVNSTLHWVRDQARAIKEFGRVLRPGGRVGISGASGDFSAWHDEIKERVLSRHPFSDYPETGGPHYLKKRDLERLLADGGFTQTDMVINPIIKSAANPDAMITWLVTSSSGQTYGGIPLELRPAAKEAMREEWEKVAGDDGKIDMKMELLVAVAAKG